MKFEENLRELRKQKGLSQEELAEQLNISRQAVSKWENGSAYPELDKLMLLCELFRCTLDDLLQGDMSEKQGVSIERYENHYHMMSKAMTFGVTVILLGISFYCFMEPYFLREQETILNIMFMVFVIIGVMAFVYFGLQSENFHKKYPQLPQQIYKESELDAFQRKYTISIVVGVGLILVSFLAQLMLDSLLHESIANGSFMLLITISVGIFVYFGCEKSMYEDTKKTENKSSKRDDVIGKWCGCIMLVATAIYLLWSFILRAWEISWIIYPIGGIICGIVTMLLNKED